MRPDGDSNFKRNVTHLMQWFYFCFKLADYYNLVDWELSHSSWKIGENGKIPHLSNLGDGRSNRSVTYTNM